MKRAPRWTDEAAVRKLVDDEMDRLEYEEVLLEVERAEIESEIGIELGPTDYDLLERKAMAQARAGNASGLALLVTDAVARARLPAEGWALIHDFLVGYRFVDEGLIDWPPKRRRRKGRPPMSEAERHRSTPTHRAAEEVPVIEAILRAHYYPLQNARDIGDRARKIAGERAGMKTHDPSQTLADYLQHGGMHRKRKPARKKWSGTRRRSAKV
jgi:hypothetical protein